MTTILFGSGATVPFFEPNLTTSYLTKQTLNLEKWENVVGEYRRHTSYPIVNASEIVDVLCRLSDFLKNLGRESNFEVLAEIIDKISSLGFDSLPGHNIINTLLAFIVKEYSFSFGTEWMDVPFLFREIIVQSILELEQNGKAKNYEILCKKLHDFIEWITKSGKRVSLVSLNYDNVLFDSIKGLGFNHCFDCVPHAGNMDGFDYFQFHENDKVIYFPHGHTRFKRNSFDAIQYFDNPEEAEKQRWAGVGNNTVDSSLTLLSSTFSYNFNTFVTTGQTKDAALNLSPYDAYYQRLSKDLLDSECVYIIGYSFGDEHINRLLHSYLYSNPFGHIIIIDFITEDVKVIDDVLNGNGLIRKLYDIFKPKIILPNTPDYSDYQFYEYRDINSQGYGKLWERLTLYKKGIVFFLNEYKDVVF